MICVFLSTPHAKIVVQILYLSTCGLQVGPTGYNVTSNWTTAKATFISDTHVLCSLPAVSKQPGGYLISIANTAGYLSEPLLMLVFNPFCFTCNTVYGNCSQKVSYSLAIQNFHGHCACFVNHTDFLWAHILLNTHIL